MSRICPLSGKKPQYGHNVSHSNRKTKRRFLPNLQSHKIWLPEQNRYLRVRISTYGIKLIDKLGFEKARLKLKNLSQK